MMTGIIIFLSSDLKECDYYNRIGLKRLLFKYEQVVEKVLRCNHELGSESPNIMILLDAETSSA